MSFGMIECVLKAEAVVGESPVWCAREQALYWVDITGQKIHRFHPSNGGNDTFVFHSEVNAEPGGSLNQNVIAEELQNHPSTQLAQQLTTIVTPEVHQQAFIDLVHNDNIVLPSGIAPAQWHATIAGAFHLH